MENTLFLYLDFLGFRKLTKDPLQVRKLFTILDKCNIHKDSNFRSIVFSDTMLAYNTAPGISKSPCTGELMYLIEFVHDLTHRLAGSDIFFRALIQYGEFEYNKLDNIETYFGNALISSYDDESKMQATGLFIQSSLTRFNRIYRSTPFSDEYHFSFLAYELVKALEFADEFPVPEEILQWQGAGIEDRIYFQIEYLRSLWQGCFHENPSIRSKFLSTWAMYDQRHPKLTKALTSSDFNPESLCNIDWESAKNEFHERKRFWHK